MTTLDDLLVDLLCALAPGAGDPADGVVVSVTQAGLDLPVEARLAADGRCLATLPRGLTRTGFDAPLGRLLIEIESAS